MKDFFEDQFERFAKRDSFDEFLSRVVEGFYGQHFGPVPGHSREAKDEGQAEDEENAQDDGKGPAEGT